MPILDAIKKKLSGRIASRVYKKIGAHCAVGSDYVTDELRLSRLPVSELATCHKTFDIKLVYTGHQPHHRLFIVRVTANVGKHEVPRSRLGTWSRVATSRIIDHEHPVWAAGGSGYRQGIRVWG